jgi:hypothetical protein
MTAVLDASAGFGGVTGAHGVRRCQRCGARLRDDQAVSIWWGRYTPDEQTEPGVRSGWREDYPVVLCGACAGPVWRRLQRLRRDLERAADSIPGGRDG